MRHFNKPTAKLRLLAGCAPAGLVLAAALGGMAAAQDSAETSTNDVITVTGYRQSLAAALDVKQDRRASSMQSLPKTLPHSRT